MVCQEFTEAIGALKTIIATPNHTIVAFCNMTTRAWHCSIVLFTIERATLVTIYSPSAIITVTHRASFANTHVYAVAATFVACRACIITSAIIAHPAVFAAFMSKHTAFAYPVSTAISTSLH